MLKSDWLPVPGLPDLPEPLRALLTGKHANCQKLVYCIWKSGRHAAMKLSCQSWRCGNCGKVKLDATAQQLVDATVDLTHLYQVFVPVNIHHNVKRYLTKKKISSLNIKLISGLVYVITSEFAIGANWATAVMKREDAVASLYNRIEINDIKRRDFTLNWKPEPLYEPKRDTVVFSRSYRNINELCQELESLGQNIRNDFIEGDVLEVVDHMSHVPDEGQIIMVNGAGHVA